MQYTKTFNIRTFEFWSGAEDRIKDMPSDELDACQAWLEAIWDGCTPSATELNDCVWFDWDDAREDYGFSEPED